jgi:hypothetical protein
MHAGIQRGCQTGTRLDGLACPWPKHNRLVDRQFCTPCPIWSRDASKGASLVIALKAVIARVCISAKIRVGTCSTVESLAELEDCKRIASNVR